jgi:rod shape-determining protein MreD
VSGLLSQTQRLVLRLSLLALGALLIQLTVLSQIEILSANADLLPLVCAAVGLLLGSMSGAAFGFGLGLLSDTASYATLGLLSLVYLSVGFAAGRARELRDPQAPSTPMVAGAATTLGVILATAVMRFLLGEGLPFSAEILRDAASTVVLNALISVPVFGLVRRLLAPVIPDDPRRRRRRSYTTGGLSPLSRS